MTIYNYENTSAIGRRVEVTINGNIIENVLFADTERGIIRFCPGPIRVQKGTDYAYTRVLRGHVKVEEF